MTLLRNIAVAFSMYSQIPMPVFEWKEGDMKYSIVFLPLIGLVIGMAEFIMLKILGLLQLSSGILAIVATLLWMAVPVILTGGFHLDGYMDVMDAIRSYKSKEEKLEILKDPHIGAFSVIALVLYGLLYFSCTLSVFEKSGYSMIFTLGTGNLDFFGITGESSRILIACLGFYMVRCLCSLTSILLTHAKKSGMLHNETKETGRTAIVIILLETILGIIFSLMVNITTTLVMATGLLIFTFTYNRKCKKSFGGVTGDTAGYYVVAGELVVMFSIFLAGLIS